MITITYSVPKISCNHCIHTINTELSELPGVKSVTADLATKTVKIGYEPPATPEKIEELLTEIDYAPTK
jgi:copper chaperone CopZ